MCSTHATSAEVITSLLPSNLCTVKSLTSSIRAIERLPATYTEHQQNAIDSFLLPTLRSAHTVLAQNSSRRITIIKQTKATFCALFDGGSFTLSRNRDGSELAQIGDIQLRKIPCNPTSYDLLAAWIFPKYTLPLVGIDNEGALFFAQPTAWLSGCALTSERICDVAKQGLTMLADFYHNGLEHNTITPHAFAFIENRLVIANFTRATLTTEAYRGERDLLNLALTLIYLLAGVIPLEIEPPTDLLTEARATFESHVDAIRQRDLDGTVEELVQTILIRKERERLNAKQAVSIFYEFFDKTLSPLAKNEQRILTTITSYFKTEGASYSLTPRGMATALTGLQTISFWQQRETPRIVDAISSFLYPTLLSAQKSFSLFRDNQAVPISRKTLELFTQLVISGGTVSKLHPLGTAKEGNAVCKYKIGGERVAGKAIVFNYYNNPGYQQTERNVLWMLASKHIIPIYGVIPLPGSIRTVTLLELADTHLGSYQRSLTRETLLSVMTDLLEGLAYLHKCGVVHGDIKPGNILVLKGGQCVFADFETAHSFTANQSIAGCTECFAPPEMLCAYRKNRGHPVYKQHGGAADIWSLGVLFVFLLTRGKEMLFSKALGEAYAYKRTTPITDEEVSEQIASVFGRHEATLEEIDPDGIVQDMARKMLVVDKKSRPTAAELVSRFLDEKPLSAERGSIVT